MDNTDIKGTILISEDNLTNMKLIRDILVYYNYRVIEAYDGKSTLDKIRLYKNELDLILMDLQLPEMDGLEVIRIVKSNDSTKNIPIIVISAYAMESDIKKALKAGANNFISKPINLEDFINKINAFFLHCVEEKNAKIKD